MNICMLYCRKFQPHFAIIPMKSYDDLQRFKEKTQTNHIEFKDMSEQTKNSDTANWAIIKQLMNDGDASSLGNGQLADIAAPQPVGADIFAAQAATPQTPRVQPVSRPAVNALVSAKPTARSLGGSLLDSISASLKPTAAAVPAPEAAASEPAVNPFAQAELAAAAAAPAPQPVFDAVQQAAPAVASQPRFKTLFSAAADMPVAALSKNTLLQPLLEKIASCR